MKKIYTITTDFTNSRLDRWFRKNVCDVPQSLIEKNIRKGYIKVNYKKEKSSYKVLKNDKIIVYNLNFIVNKYKKTKTNYVATKKDLSHTFSMFVENNENFVVINKPAGISIHPGPGNYDNTIVNALMNYCGKNLSNIGDELRPGIVHRIDKDTSGLIVVAKNNLSHENLSIQFNKHSINLGSSPYNKTLIRFKKTEDMFNFIYGYNIAMEGSYT